MTTAQDQQSRAEFDRYWLARQRARGYGEALTDGEMLSRPHRRDDEFHAWQAARALPTGMAPVAEIENGSLRWHIPAADYSVDVKRLTGLHQLFTAAQVQAMGRVPPGWQAAPVDATRAMIDAANAVEEDGYDAMHKAMLAAAPRPPEPVAPNRRHAFRPNKKYPWFCADCGYEPHDELMHTAAPRPPAAQEGA